MSLIPEIFEIYPRQYKCDVCGLELAQNPPCPRCRNPVKIIIFPIEFQSIFTFLEHNKGSKGIVYRGEKNNEPILVIELYRKKELKEVENASL